MSRLRFPYILKRLCCCGNIPLEVGPACMSNFLLTFYSPEYLVIFPLVAATEGYIRPFPPVVLHYYPLVRVEHKMVLYSNSHILDSYLDYGIFERYTR